VLNLLPTSGSLYIHPHLMVIFTATYHILSTVYTPFLTCHIFWPQTISSPDIWSDLHIYLSTEHNFSEDLDLHHHHYENLISQYCSPPDPSVKSETFCLKNMVLLLKVCTEFIQMGDKCWFKMSCNKNCTCAENELCIMVGECELNSSVSRLV
jgi:hypothetical protein